MPQNKKVIIITGSTSGIGFNLAKAFIHDGHHVIINGRNKQHLDQALNLLPNAIGVLGDITSEQTHHNLIKTAIENFGRLNIWINNAAIPQKFDFLLNLSNQHIQNLINTNIYGTILGTKIAAEFFISQGFGQIFNMNGFGSNGHVKQRLSIYGTTKRAVNYFTRAFYNEYKKYNITVGLINPGMVKTPFLTKSLQGLPQELVQQNMKFNEIFASDPEAVAQFIKNKILNNTKHFTKINYLTLWRLIPRLIKAKKALK